MQDDYSLVGSKDISELKQDVDFLKRNPFAGKKEGKTLLSSIETLNERISDLIEIFKEASDQAKMEGHEEEHLMKRLDPIENRLEELGQQNEKIAKGILAVAEMVSKAPKPAPRPMMAPRPLAPMPRSAPMPAMAPPKLPPMGGAPVMVPPGMPPPPKKEKKGLFAGLLKK